MRFALVLAVIAAPASAQDHGPVNLTNPPPLAKDVDAYPRVVGETSAIAKINARLADREARLRDDLAECLAVKNGFVEHSVALTMNSPNFLTFVSTTGAYCGGAHGYGGDDALTFDLRTGDPIDPQDWLPSSLDPGVTPPPRIADDRRRTGKI